MVDGGRADEPDGRGEVGAARDDVVHVEQLVQVELGPILWISFGRKIFGIFFATFKSFPL
jgi:hypothetical protein